MENLKSLANRTKEEQREIAKKGGIKSGEVRRARKTLKEELLLLLSKGDTQEKMSLSMIAKALNGDVKAFEVIRDTIGEKPVEKIDNVNPQVQKIFITKKDTKKANKLIDEFIEKQMFKSKLNIYFLIYIL